MGYQDFIATVQEVAHIADDEAERASCATLQTLAERISTGETEDLAERLPDELRSCLTADERDRFHVDEFIRRISERAGLEPPAAERDARAVLGALWLAVGPDEFADMRSELPNDFAPLLDGALRDAPPPVLSEPAPADAMSYEDFVERVAEHAGIDHERAQREGQANRPARGASTAVRRPRTPAPCSARRCARPSVRRSGTTRSPSSRTNTACCGGAADAEGTDELEIA